MKSNEVNRCCIISGDNSNSSAKNSFQKKSIEHIKGYINKKKEENGFSGMVLFTSIIAVLCIALLFFTPAYDVYVDGVKIGAVPDKEYFCTVYENVNYDIGQIAGNYYTLDISPAYVFRIIPKNMFTPLETLTDNLMSLSDGVKHGFVIYADGTKVSVASSREDIESALLKLKSSYEGDEASIVNKIEIKPEYVASIENVESSDSLLHLLANTLSVQTCKTVTYSEPIYHPTEEIPDDKLRLGRRNVVQTGVDGKREVTAQLVYINGTETEKNIISSVETTPPVAEIVNIGTREVSGEGSGSFTLPFDGMVSSRFGRREGRNHKGIDIAGKEGSPVEAADNGVVKTAVTRYDYGKLIILDHNNGVETYYAHLSSIDVSVGDIVEKGDIIGKVGNTGISTGPHLHFEVRVDGVPQDPAGYIY